jgi:hypothetical protein
MKNVWPAARERPDEKTSIVPHMDIDIDMLDYRMTVAYEDLMDESCQRVQ